jgi:LAO/AO transport system kinase
MQATPATATCSSARWPRAATSAGLAARPSPRRPCSPRAASAVFIETVGTGQSEVEVASIADTTVVVQAPEMGDEVQAIKAGLLEVADIVVVNKGDRPGAERAAAQLRGMLTVGAQHDRAMGDRPRPKRPDVLLVSALTGAGVAELLAALDRRRAAAAAMARRRWRPSAAGSAPRRSCGASSPSGCSERLREPRHAPGAARIRAVAAHDLDPFEAADSCWPAGAMTRRARLGR